MKPFAAADFTDYAASIPEVLEAAGAGAALAGQETVLVGAGRVSGA